VHVAGILTALSGVLAWVQMKETLPRARIAADSTPLRTVGATPDSATPQTR
jgi:hypothetical protein